MSIDLKNTGLITDPQISDDEIMTNELELNELELMRKLNEEQKAIDEACAAAHYEYHLSIMEELDT